MCGIAGYVSSRLGPEEREIVVARMQRAMVHRGPDSDGRLNQGPATWGARRLAVFDPARGSQPSRTTDGRFALVFNGALYNFRSLREELRARGHTFRTECDTEVLLAAWVEWREAALPRLRGMFAFAVWDATTHSAVLARDPFGIKPLYFRQAAGELVFASELNALIAGRSFAPEFDPAAIDAYLGYLAVPAPGTIYREVYSLRPGEWAEWKDGRLSVRAGWRFPRLTPATPAPDHGEFMAELRHRLEDTVAAHQLADVSVGAFLSGGLDSAAIVGLMARNGGQRVKTFSLGFTEREFSETDAAAATARHFGTVHQAIALPGAEVAAGIEAFVAALDQPTGDGLNTYHLSRAARAGGVTVALSGLGGDELFGGYSSFRRSPWIARALSWWRHTPPPWQDTVRRQLRRGGARPRKLADLLAAPPTLHHVALHQRRVLSDDLRRELLRTPAEPTVDHPELGRLPQELLEAAPAAVVSAWELRTYLADVLLRDSDTMSMAHALELRVPFIDRPLVEWLWAQPARFRFTPRAPKSALHRAMGDLLPAHLRRQRKRGFTLPMDRWMRQELKPFLEATLAAETVHRTGLLNAAAVQRLWRDYLAGSDSHQWSRVWSTAILVAFLNRARPA